MNKLLFIFNFDYMRNFLLNLFLFFLPITIVLGSIEFTLRSIPNDYKYKKRQMESHADNINILCLGASNGYYGIMPSKFTYDGYSLAFVSQSYKYDNWLYKKYISKCKSIRYIVLPVSYPMLRMNLENSPEWWRIKGYCIYMGCNYHLMEPKYHLEISTKDKLKQLLREDFFWINHQSCDSLGWGTKYKKENRVQDWKSTGNSACIRHTNQSQEFVLENVQYIQEIIDDCERRSIKVILLTTPTYKSYYDLLEPIQLHEMFEICYEFDNKHEHVVYLNWLKHNEFTEDDFFDADHLNEYGAEKLTKMLDEYIMSWQ